MMASNRLAQSYYAQHGPITDPGTHGPLLDALPESIDALCECVQGLVIHRSWADAYGITLPAERSGDAQARSVSAILDRVVELDPRPLSEQRDPERRFAGTCRDFAVLLSAILRHRGVPARARCGFGGYFVPGRFEDHWICEHWDPAAERWVQTDAQIDALQRTRLGLDFDPLDLPDDRFVVAGRAWRRCRAGDADPAHFGIFDMHGLWFVRGNVVRDLAALNRMEMLPWDDWGMVLRLGESEDGPAEDVRLIDTVAELTHGAVESFEDVRALYDGEAELCIPGQVRNWQTGEDERVGSP
jgi:hypothetical protein